MSEIKTDIEIWKEEYAFLEDVWTRYESFDNSVEDDTNLYDSLCNLNLENLCVELSEYKDFCKKLMRNLGYFTLVTKDNQLSSNRCYILYNWIYNSMVENSITENIVNKCFEIYNNYMVKKESPIICDNISKYEIYDSRKIILINVLNANMPYVINTLIEEKDPIGTPRHKFLCECVKIYKEMNGKYCPYIDDKKKLSTCSMLGEFKENYKTFLNDDEYEKYKIPSLDDTYEKLLVKCPEYEKRLKLNSDAPEIAVTYRGKSLSTHTERQSNVLADDRTIILGNVDSPTKKTRTATISTFAGASLPLALLYKFTPLRSWINTKILGKDKLLDNMKKNEQKFLSNSAHTRDIYSGDRIYRIKYNSVLNE